jgi:hypothetical protein
MYYEVTGDRPIRPLKKALILFGGKNVIDKVLNVDYLDKCSL